MAEIVRRRSWGGVLPLGRHVSISGSRSIHAPSVSIAPSSFQEEQNARHHKQFKLEQALALQLCFSLTAVVSGGGFGLVLSSPVRPGHDKAGSDWGPEQKTRQKIADLGHRGQQRGQAH